MPLLLASLELGWLVAADLQAPVSLAPFFSAIVVMMFLLGGEMERHSKGVGLLRLVRGPAATWLASLVYEVLALLSPARPCAGAL